MPTRVVFEAGPTHSGIDEALALVAAAKGADAIKFQLIDADRLVADHEKRIAFKVLDNGEMSERTESLHAILKRRELEPDDWLALRDAASEAGLAFYSTAAYEDEFDFLIKEMEVDGVKIASADIDHLPLLRYVADRVSTAAHEVEVHLDTGSGELWEIDRAVTTLREGGVTRVVIHHVPSGYPAHTESINLRMLGTLRMMFPDHTIGFSDHSPGTSMDFAAIALGAELVEKTLTLDRTRPEIEHSFSLEPNEVAPFIAKVRELEIALGSTRRVLPADVLASRQGFRRSLYLTEPVKKGEPIEPIECRRPGYGIPPASEAIIKGRTAKRDLTPGLLDWDDL